MTRPAGRRSAIARELAGVRLRRRLDDAGHRATRPSRGGAVATPALLWAFLSLALGLAGCSSGESAPHRPNVLLISLDTLRADLLDAHGFAEAPLPALDRLAGQSVRFVNAYSPMAFTLPAHMTLFTGLHPETHGVSTGKSRLDERVVSLPAHLRANGYRTVGVVGGSWLKSEFGFGAGFDAYEELPAGLMWADRVRPRVVEELEEADRSGRPLFFFAHFFDAHSDWNRADNQLTYYSPPEYRAGLEVPAECVCDELDRCATDLLRFADREERELPEDQLAVHRELYRRGALYLDDQIGQLLDEIDRKIGLDKLLIVLVSDHGEEFREHGRLLHSQIYRESLRVPLLVRLPGSGRSGEERRELVGLEDVAPTIAARLDLPVPAAWQGADLLAAPGPERPRLVQDKLVRTTYGLRTLDELFVWDFGTDSGRLYDLRDDPGEERPEPGDADRFPDRLNRLTSELRRLRGLGAHLSKRPASVLTDAEKEVLRSLGYL